jgi:hypothetical protein
VPWNCGALNAARPPLMLAAADRRDGSGATLDRTMRAVGCMTPWRNRWQEVDLRRPIRLGGRRQNARAMAWKK